MRVSSVPGQTGSPRSVLSSTTLVYPHRAGEGTAHGPAVARELGWGGPRAERGAIEFTAHGARRVIRILSGVLRVAPFSHFGRVG